MAKVPKTRTDLAPISEIKKVVEPIGQRNVAGEQINPATEETLVAQLDITLSALRDAIKDYLSRATEVSVASGDASGGSTTTLEDDAAVWEVNKWADAVAEITDVSTGNHYYVTVTSNTADTLTFPAIAVAVVDGDHYEIRMVLSPTNMNKWGGSSLTGRDISADLQALTDPLITGILKSIGDIAAAESLIARIGAIADTVVDAGAEGSASAKLRRLTTDINALITRMGEVQDTPTANTVLDRLKDIETAIGTLTPAAGAPVIYNVTMTNLDAEYSQALPANTKKYTIQTRDGTAFRLAFETGKVAAPDEPYFSIGTDGFHHEDLIEPASLTLFFACGEAGKVAEILTWS